MTATTTSVVANDVVPGDWLFWCNDRVDVHEVVIDARRTPGRIVLVGVVVRTAEPVRLFYARDDWVTVTRREDRR